MSTDYRDKAISTITLPALVFTPRQHASGILRSLRGWSYVQRGVRSVIDVSIDENGGIQLIATPNDAAASEGKGLQLGKLCLLVTEALTTYSTTLSAGLSSPTVVLSDVADLKSELLDGLYQKLEKVPHIADVKMGLCYHNVTLTYLNYTMPELLRLSLPSHSALAILSGFEQVGAVAHVNLSSGHIPYQQTIGQVIIDCNPTVDVVVNKVDSISSVYREFNMEIIAARHHSLADIKEMSEQQYDALLLASVRQHGCVFQVPYNKVYFNARLSHEHTRLVDAMNPGDVLLDVMAGVGPFAVPAAKKGVHVLANDLNPEAAKYLTVNAELNRTTLTAYNMDGRDFLNTQVFDAIMHNRPPVPAQHRIHVTMNLPAIAVEFLDVFHPSHPSSSSSPWRGVQGKRPMNPSALFHVYCFSSAADVCEDGVRMVEHWLGCPLPPSHLEGSVMVRDVSPLKRMVCVSFTLPSSLWEVSNEDGEPKHKARRLSEEQAAH